MKHFHVRPIETVAEFDVVEHLADVNVNTNISNQTTNMSSLNQNTSSTNNNVNNSQRNTSISNTASSTVNTQNTSNNTAINNSTNSNIVSNSTTSNVNNSVTSTVSDSSNKVNNIMKCGLDAAGAQNLVAQINDSININNNASNSFIATGNNNTISDVKLSSLLTSYGPSIDKSCVQKALSESQTKQDVSNSNAASQSGSTFSSEQKSGGNTASTENATAGSNQNASQLSGDSSASGKGSADLKSSTDQTASSDQSADQSSKQSAKAGGIKEVNTVFIIVMIAFAVLYYMEKYQNMSLYSDVIGNIKEYYHIYLLGLVFLLSYLYNL